MNKPLKVGIIGTADIAQRRFLPALNNCEGMEYVGVASRTKEKAERFVAGNGGKAYVGYESMIEDQSIDIIYLPLPPALHYEWAKKALLSGKHVLVEKPSFLYSEQAIELCELAKTRGLALLENYAFLYHHQLDRIKELLNNDAIGKIRLIQCKFGFPRRAEGDFRYDKLLGGGALFDCGGYTIKLASELLGDQIELCDAYLNYEGEEVDLYGSAVLRDSKGLTAQIAFGMDNDYKCELDIWGSNGGLKASRIYTSNANMPAKVILYQNGQEIAMNEYRDDQFQKIITVFRRSIMSEELRKEGYRAVIKQAKLISEMLEMSKLQKN